MPISIDQHFTDNELICRYTKWIEVLRMTGKAIGCVNHGYSKVKKGDILHLLQVDYNFPTPDLGLNAPHFSWCPHRFTAKNEYFINCWNNWGSGSKSIAILLQKELVKHVPCRVTKFESNVGVAVDFMAAYELDYPEQKIS